MSSPTSSWHSAPSIGLLVGACAAAMGTITYLAIGFPYTVPHLVLALAILLWPLRRLPVTAKQALRTAGCWAGLGLLGTYLFGTLVLMASVPALIGGLLGRRAERRRAVRRDQPGATTSLS